ncbi:MAG: hypothetical protein JXR71_11355 [Bacteroidales bacterium]|nr:hypothetical protein [Bacteroidales bacterium]
MKKFLTVSVLLIILIGNKAYSQVGVVYYSSNVVAVNMPILKMNENSIAGELKVFSNRQFKDVATELDLFYRFKEMKYHRFSVGLGFKTEFFTDGGNGNTFLVPVALEVFPLQNFKKLSFLFELAPEIIFDNQARLRSLIGLKYSFGK